MPRPKQVRTKVYVDREGAEWRSVAGELQSRIHKEGEEGELDSAFGTGEGFENSWGWALWLTRLYPQSIKPAVFALADPMTAEEAAADDADLVE